MASRSAAKITAIMANGRWFSAFIGLGSDLLPPLSLVLDKRGIYYDATRPSDLEVLLNHSQLTLAQQMRAENYASDWLKVN